MLTRPSSTHRVVASLVVGHWGQCPAELLALLNSILSERTTYEEIVPYLMTMQRECHVRLLEITRLEIYCQTPVFRIDLNGKNRHRRVYITYVLSSFGYCIFLLYVCRI